MNDLLSIIIPIYNTAPYLSECINSVLTQTYKNIEIVLVDDGSTDNSKAICEQFLQKDSRVKFYSKINGGVSSARNYGIDCAKGQYICFIDSDDYVLENHLLCLKDNYEEDSFCCCTPFKEFSLLRSFNTNSIRISLQEFKSNYLWITCFMVLNSPINKLYSKQIIDQNNLRFQEDITIGEDALFNLAYLSCVSNITLLDKDTYYYRIHGDSATHFFHDKATLDRLETNSRIWDFFDISEADYKAKAYKIMTFLNIINADLQCNATYVDKQQRLQFLLEAAQVNQQILNLKMPFYDWFGGNSLIRLLKMKNYKRYLSCIIRR